MAAVGLAAKTALDLRAILSAQKLARWSNQDAQKDSEGEVKAEDTAVTLKVAQKACAKLLYWFGVQTYDDDAEPTDELAGYILDLAVRRALLMYSQYYTVALTPQGLEFIGDVNAEIEALIESQQDAAGDPVIGQRAAASGSATENILGIG